MNPENVELFPICPNCGEHLELDNLPEVDCNEETVSIETTYWCDHCKKEFVFRTEGKIAEWGDTVIEELP